MKFAVLRHQSSLVLACFCVLSAETILLGQSGRSVRDGGSRNEAEVPAAGHGATDALAGAHPVVPSDFALGPGDTIAVTVWKDTELSRTMPVRPDGMITLPVLGELRAAGLTALELQQLISDKLRPYMRNPEVTVIVQEIKSRTFNVVGKIVKPGSYDLIKPTTVLDAIALGGGFQEYARLSKIYVLRRSPTGSETMIPFNYKEVIKGKRADQNIQLMPGDTVVVP